LDGRRGWMVALGMRANGARRWPAGPGTSMAPSKCRSDEDGVGPPPSGMPVLEFLHRR
jgi:hypothetical protein